ncbi:MULTISPECIES: hypothetical protein [unclassified Sporolactobacillus]|uniref:hypothetical protein n=1 Tax=unclassified Sporolactobacillus TaxID=2628533 RepID=UPI002367C7E3|nr:hypothetical protein [Sporolactobacillus sp. CQH2019]MDD9148539.1 hypothetical protein [Sporolactobacillus sp. CQH2019]
MAKQIVSIKVPIKSVSALTLKRALRLYETIKKSRSTAYFSANEKTFCINDLPETIKFLSSLQGKEILLIIEGEDADALYRRILDSIKLLRENARENPGLYRQE